MQCILLLLVLLAFLAYVGLEFSKMHPWMIQGAKKRVLFSGLMSVWSTWYYVLWWHQMFPNIQKLPDHEGSISSQWNAFFERSKVPKKRFLAIFWTGANLRNLCWIDLILHTVIVLNVFQHEVILLHVTRGWGYTSSCYKGVEGGLVWCAVWYSKVKVAAFIFYGG